MKPKKSMYAGLAKAAEALEGLDVQLLDEFTGHALEVMQAVTDLDERARRLAEGTGLEETHESLYRKLLNETGFVHEADAEAWAGRMLALLGPEKLREGLKQYLVHERSLYIEGAGLNLLLLTVRNTVDEITHGGKSIAGIAFSERDHALALASTIAMELWPRKHEWWQASIHAERYDWADLRHPDHAPVFQALCRQIVDGRIWRHASGLFCPEASKPAVASPPRIEGLKPGWRTILRGLLILGLRQGWVSADEAERITALHPRLEPWWLLSMTAEQMRAQPPALRDFSLRLRERFPGAMAKLPEHEEPGKLFDLRLEHDPEMHHETWSYERHVVPLRGSAALLAAARWAERHPKRMADRDDWNVQAIRRLGRIAGLDDGESEDEVVAALRKVSKEGRAALYPWAGESQSLILRALGLESTEPLRQWLRNHVGADPGHLDQPYSAGRGAIFDNSPDPRGDVVDVAALRSTVAAVPAKARQALLAMYTKASQFQGADQLFGAVMGEADRAKIREAACVKENQRAIKLLGLLPAAGENDVRDRYIALQQLGKQAARHGAQRQASQRAAVQVALALLAQVAGDRDAGDLEWMMEAGAGHTLRASFAPRRIDGYEAWIAIEDLKAVLRVRNDSGKVLASVPSALKKHAAMKALEETLAGVREQLRRFTRLMEVRMTNAAPVSLEQLRAGFAHPVMAPIIESLLWIDEAGAIGCFGESGLAGPEGTRAATGETLRVAHSVDLLKAGAAALSGWQRWLVETRRVQAFKQVFREIYLPTPAELEAGECSRRYADRTIRAGVAQGILQARNWIPPRELDEDGGVQRLVFAGGLTAKCAFGVGHWFTEDEDAETGEMWFERDGKPIPLAQVPPIVFSEAMRDIDLVVSRAIVVDAGGEDTAASVAAISVRADLLRALAPALGPGVLELEERHAIVRGKLTRYRIHLASGHVHAEPGAYVCIIPDRTVANARRDVRLPFAEDDPRTAEIVSKVFLLAHDDAIKDESILSQIRRSVPA